jgi:hypothetical protein
MSRRKREITGLTNERDFPHLVDLARPPGGFRSMFFEFDAFHRERRIPVRRGQSRHEAEQFYIRFCFPDTATAEAFQNRFGGECLTCARGKPKPGTSKNPKSTNQPGMFAGSAAKSDELKRCMDFVSDEMRELIERLWPELVHKLVAKGRRGGDPT